MTDPRQPNPHPESEAVGQEPHLPGAGQSPADRQDTPREPGGDPVLLPRLRAFRPDDVLEESPLTDAELEALPDALGTTLDLRHLCAIVNQAAAEATKAGHEAHEAKIRAEMATATAKRHLFLESFERIGKTVLPFVAILAVVSTNVAGLLLNPWAFSTNFLLAPIAFWAVRRALRDDYAGRPTDTAPESEDPD